MSVIPPTGSSNVQVPVAKANGALDTADFLGLLVGQLKNQNPTSPTDTNQLLGQMVAYASYGQQEGTNKALEDTNAALAFMAQTLDALAAYILPASDDDGASEVPADDAASTPQDDVEEKEAA